MGFFTENGKIRVRFKDWRLFNRKISTFRARQTVKFGKIKNSIKKCITTVRLISNRSKHNPLRLCVSSPKFIKKRKEFSHKFRKSFEYFATIALISTPMSINFLSEFSNDDVPVTNQNRYVISSMDGQTHWRN